MAASSSGQRAGGVLRQQKKRHAAVAAPTAHMGSRSTEYRVHALGFGFTHNESTRVHGMLSQKSTLASKNIAGGMSSKLRAPHLSRPERISKCNAHTFFNSTCRHRRSS